MEFTYQSLSQLLKRKHKRNPRLHNLRSVIQSMVEFGFVEPIVYNARTNRILHGHGRVDALQEIKRRGGAPPARIEVDDGEWLVPTLSVEVDESDEELVAIALNRASELGDWNPELLNEILARLDHSRRALLDALQFDTDALKEKLQHLANQNTQLNETQLKNASNTSLEESIEAYLKSEYYQVVLLYTIDDYKSVLGWLERAREEFRVDTNSEAVRALLEARYAGDEEANENA